MNKLPKETLYGSILITGGRPSDRDTTVNELLESNKLPTSNNPDLLLVDILEDKASIGIAQIRDAITWLSNKPFSHLKKILILNQADKITPEGQNTLLKTLEEPPKYACIILLSKSDNALLPTVLSRCRRFKIQTEVSTVDNINSFSKFLNLSKGARLDWAEETSKEEKETIIEMLEEWLSEGRKLGNAQNLKLLIEVKSDLETTNVNQRLALEYLALHIV